MVSRLRAVFTLATTALLSSASGAFAQKPPPSSLKRPGSVVRVTHSHQLVKGCAPNPAISSCLEKRSPAPAATELTLTPLPAGLVSKPTEPRGQRRLALPSAIGSSSAETRLEPGRWLLSWQDQSTALRVAEARPVAVQLTTISGRCVAVPSGCQLQADFVRRELSIPAEFRASEAH